MKKKCLAALMMVTVLASDSMWSKRNEPKILSRPKNR